MYVICVYICLPLFDSASDICGNCVVGPLSGSGTTYDLSVSHSINLNSPWLPFVEFNSLGIRPSSALNRFQLMELRNIGLDPIDFK